MMNKLSDSIRQCTVCQEHLPLGARPVVQLSAFSKIVLIGQAPGRRVHETGIPWNDPSGRALRAWLDVDEKVFYDPAYFSIFSTGFCYPGKGKSGDLPPRPECAPLWHPQIFSHFETTPLILLIGQYAQRYYLKKAFRKNLTETVKNYQDFLPKYFPLPHPSPRNQYWMRANPWFTEEVVPGLQASIQLALSSE